MILLVQEAIHHISHKHLHSAYGFAPASTIAPLGTTTLVSNVILAPMMLKERFRFRDILGVICAVFGATVVVLSSKSEEIKASHITSDLAMSTSTCKLILSYVVIQLSPDLVVEYLTSMEAIIYYSVTGGLILLLTALSPRWGSTSILIDLGLVALYGKNFFPCPDRMPLLLGLASDI
jgi:drug/metabolite transporter (DMT)-like permease